LYRELVFQPLVRESLARIEHVRVDGKVINLTEGILAAADAAERRVVVRRFFRGGRYDGLDLPIEGGDYALTECREGDMFVRHTYYSRKGVSKGVYVNINTPVELYPWGVRYVDLEIDVVRRGNEEPFLVDREKLKKITAQGFISPALEERASETAIEVLGLLKESRDR
jgi:Ribonuclease G/E